MSEKTIYRIIKDKENPYVMINKQFLNDERLSWKAKGILTYLLSMPDDWQIYENELVKHSKDGITSLKSGIKELIEFGYIIREQVRNEKGQFKGYEYYVYEVSTEIRKSNIGDPNNGKPNTTNNNITNNDLTKESIYIGEDRTNVLNEDKTKEEIKSEKEEITLDYKSPPLDTNDNSLDINNIPSDILLEAQQLLGKMKEVCIEQKSYFLEYYKVRQKYSKDEIFRSVDRYNQFKDLKGENKYHYPENYFSKGVYFSFLDNTWKNTFRGIEKKKKHNRLNKSSNEPEILDEWDKQLIGLGWGYCENDGEANDNDYHNQYDNIF